MIICTTLYFHNIDLIFSMNIWHDTFGIGRASHMVCLSSLTLETNDKTTQDIFADGKIVAHFCRLPGSVIMC